MYQLTLCTQSLSAMIADHPEFDITTLKFERNADMCTIITGLKSELVSLAFHMHQWEGSYSSFSEEDVPTVLV